MSNGSKRYFNGFVSEFVHTGNDSQFTLYRAEMVPWLWFLRQTSDCRIFQNKTVPEIVKEIFQEFGCRDFRSALRGAYERIISIKGSGDVVLKGRKILQN
ncbi:MAG: contractile injection system protein, VgrG/Pvc8 family [Candidatus Binatia bacterium]